MAGRLRVACCLLAYLLFSAVLYWKLLTHLDSDTYGGNDADLFAWWLRELPHAVRHASSPFSNADLFAPRGINAMWNTAVPVLAAVAAPLTLTAGPLVTLNLLMMLAPVVSAAVVLLLARRYFSLRSAFLAGLLFGFSPYFVGQAIHLHLTYALFPPLLLVLLLEAVVHQRRRPVRLGVLLGALTGLQLLVGEELLVSSLVLAGLTLAVLALCWSGQVRARLPYLGKVLLPAVLVAAVIDVVPLYVQFFGPQVVHGAIQARHPGVDLLSFVVPTPLQALHPGVLASVSRRVSGTNGAEQTAYLGLPMLLLLAWSLHRLRNRAERWLAVPLGLAAVMALGASLHVYGHRLPVPLPARVLTAVPLLGSVIPARFSVFVFLFAALIVAAALDLPRSGALPSWAPAAVVVLTIVTLLPTAPLPAYPAGVPPFFRARRDLDLIPAQSAVLVAPWPSGRFASPMLWQAEAGMRFRLLGGYGVVPGDTGRPQFQLAAPTVEQIIASIASGHPAPALRSPVARSALRELDRLHVRVLLISPMTYQVQAADWLSQLLRVTATPVGGVDLLVRPALPGKS